MAKKLRQEWSEGDVFLVPQSDGTSSVGQVLRITKRALNSVICSFYRLKASEEGVDGALLTEDALVAILFTAPDLLSSGAWRVVAHAAPRFLERTPRLTELETQGWVGARIVGSGNVMKLLDALYGLRPWDAFANPEYLDTLLLSPGKKPREGLVYAKR